MDPRTVISYSLLLCVIGDFRVRCEAADSKVSTNFTTQIADSDNSETKFSSNYRKVPNNLHDESSERDEVEGSPPDHQVPYSSHEDPEEPSTKPKYTKPGDWAKPKANVPLDFVPTKLYAQVRGTHTVKRLPREEALKSAETEEEVLAAPRLRAVVSKSKKNTVYTEEGYEDAAYDHAGHIRDADFHEGFARKLEDQQNIAKGRKKKLKKNDKEDIKLEESNIAEEFNDYDDDYRDHAEESSNIEESSPKKRKDSEKRQYKKLKSLLNNSEIDPKQVTENEIEKLEEDLNKEYEESEKNTEKEVPENLKNSGSDDDEEDDVNSRDYGSRIGKEIDESQAASRAMLDDIKISVVESQNDEIRKASATPNNIDNSPQNSALTTESNDSPSLPGEFLSTPDYGKLFWDYYKTDGSIWDLQEASTPKVTSTTIVETNKAISQPLTSVPSFPIAQSTIGIYDTFKFTPPSTELSSFSFNDSTDFAYPSANTFYESWKRRDRNNVNEHNYDHENVDSVLNINPTGSIETTEADNDPALSLQSGQSATTLIGPKKLSYTVIIRSNDKSTTQSPDCDHANHSKQREPVSNENPILHPGYTESLSEFGEQVGSEATNNFHAPEQDFTVIRPPLPVPLGQVTFADFLPDPYGSLVHPSVAHESGQQVGQEINGERDIYKASESPYDYPLQNHVNPEASHVRHHRGPHPGRKRNHHYTLLTKLVPPLPMNRSKYADYLGVKRNVRPKTRFDRSSRGVWPELINFYRTVDQTFFGRRRKRSLEGRTTHEKVKDSVVTSRENNLQERNLFNDEVNRLAAASTGSFGLSSDYNVQREKTGKSRKRRNDEDLFNETPKIAEEVINSEIESRFKDEEDDEENDDDSLENDRAKTEIEVPAFNFSEVIKNNKRQKVISSDPSKVQTLNLEKYPFYGNSEVSRSDSALKYITNPRQVPRKTLGGTEFYDSRDKYLECADVEPDLEKVVPEDEEPNEDREQQGDQPRLHGLGDKLDCFRAKYFDENPLDNPLFLEKQVGEPRFPKDLDPAKFASRIDSIKNNHHEEQVIRRVSKKPEVHDLHRSGSRVHKVTQQGNRNHQNPADENRSTGRGRIKYHRGRDDHKEYKQRRPAQTTTEQPELPVTPYEHEVYEDVMGTIKNLAGMYQTFGESVLSPSIQPNVNYLPTNPGGKDWNSPIVHITEKPRGFMLRGMLPPQPSEYPTLHRYRITPYRTNRVSYGIRPIIETLPGTKGMKIGYFKTVRVNKRSLDDVASSDMEAEASRSVSVRSTDSPGNTSRSTTPERTVYTIRDRFRHSKPRGNIGRNGKFTNLETAGTEDIRRREPRYNRTQRRKVPPSTEESATTTNWDESDAKKAEKQTVNTSQKPSGSGRAPRQDFHDEPGELYKIQFSTPQRRQARPSDVRRRAENSRSSEAEQRSDEDTTDTTENRKYDVREDAEDNVTTAPAIYELQKYLESDPPGYSEAFGEESTEPSGKYTEEENTPAQNYEKTEKQEDEESEEGDEQIERPAESYVEEESSPNSEEAEDERDSQSETYKNSDDDEENDEEEKEQPSKDEEGSHAVDGEKEFLRFASRPFSPFESYDDPKYSDLGPRLSKPSFHHPSFTKPSSTDSGERKYSSESDDDSEEADGEKRSGYVFPWSHDEESKEGAEESKKSLLSIERYEYPWEKRERLAKERRRKRKEREEYEKLFAFPDSAEADEEEEEQDASNTEIIRRRVYPWERYDMPSKKYRRVKTSPSSKIIDNDEMGSEYRPVTKFSSRYKSGRFNSNDDDPITASGADPKEIRVSIMKSIEDAAKETENTTNAEASKASATQVASSTVPSKRNRRRKFKSSTISTTIPPVSTTKKPRMWRVASSTTKKPIRSHARRTNIAETELLKSGSQRKEVTTNPAGRSDLNSSVNISSTVNRRNVRRRGQSANRSSTTTTTARPLHRRLQKTTTSPKEAEASTTEIVTERTTTPSSKTVEHHSRFSKEEIITKTSYPRMKPEDSNDKKDQVNSKTDEKKDSTDGGKHSKESMNERVEKVSIVTKETPEHIYRKEEIDKDGVKGMFVSIMPNDGTNSTKDSKTNAEETKEMLKRFETSEDDVRDAEDSLGGSFMHDNYLLANLLRQVPPYKNDWTLDDNCQDLGTVYEEEGSGSFEMEDDVDEPSTGLPTPFVKDPNERLYFYVEK